MQVLRPLAEKFPQHEHPDLLVGLSLPDDAAVYRLNDEQAIIQTVDFFPPIVDDPYTYGAIAAANAMGDVYAMGGAVISALNIAAFPDDLPPEILGRILEGGADKVKEAGGVLAGGHTVADREPMYGLCVTGLIHPDRIRTNAGARPGDVLLLTKPLGVGILIGAIRQDRAKPAHADAAIGQMLRLNATVARVAQEFDVHAMTDVTGFGLVGHLSEMASHSRVRVGIELGGAPAVVGLEEYVGAGLETAGQQRNAAYFGADVAFPRALSPLEEALLFDPQTSGGLVIALTEADAHPLQERLAAAETPSWRIGTVSAGRGVAVSL